MKIKTVCINLENSKDRRQHMLNIADKIHLPFNFFKACDYNDITIKYNDDEISVVDPGPDLDYIITINNKLYGEIYYKNEFTGLYHNPKRYLEDQVEHFGRKHYQDYHNIPYAHPIKCVDFQGDHTKKWINYKGESVFFVDITNFRKYIAKPEIACALSHYKIFEQLVNDDEFDAYLILEDDVVLQQYDDEPDFNLKNVLYELDLYTPLWDIAYLNEPKFISPNSLKEFNKFWNMGIFSNFTDACSYIITKKTAKKLIELHNQHIDLCADDFLTRQVYLCSLRTKKPIFINNYTNESTIRSPEIEDEMEDLFQKYNLGIINL